MACSQFTPSTRTRQNCLVLSSCQCEHNCRQDKTVLSRPCRRCEKAIRPSCKLETGSRRDKTKLIETGSEPGQNCLVRLVGGVNTKQEHKTKLSYLVRVGGANKPVVGMGEGETCVALYCGELDRWPLPQNNDLAILSVRLLHSCTVLKQLNRRLPSHK